MCFCTLLYFKSCLDFKSCLCNVSFNELAGVTVPGSVHVHSQHPQILSETGQDRQGRAAGSASRATATQECGGAGVRVGLSFRGPHGCVGPQPRATGSTGRPPHGPPVGVPGQARTAARGPPTTAASATGAGVVVAPAACFLKPDKKARCRWCRKCSASSSTTASIESAVNVVVTARTLRCG